LLRRLSPDREITGKHQLPGFALIILIDECSRVCLAIRVGRRCKARDVVAVLEELTSVYPAPMVIRFENGPDLIAQARRNGCDASDTTTTADIKPGSPWKNRFAES